MNARIQPGGGGMEVVAELTMTNIVNVELLSRPSIDIPTAPE